ncbi:MAG: hypothetical protein R3F02_12320 [Thiolinea sp.]
MDIKRLFKVWVMGDFSDIEKEAKRQQWLEDQLVKDKNKMSWVERLKENIGEWVLGNFSNREARNRNEKRKAYYEELKKRKRELKETRLSKSYSSKKSLKIK